MSCTGGKMRKAAAMDGYTRLPATAFQHVVKGGVLYPGRPGRTLFAAGMYNRRGMVNDYNKLFLYVLCRSRGVLSKSNVKDLNNDGEEPINNPGYNNNVVYSARFPRGSRSKVCPLIPAGVLGWKWDTVSPCRISWTGMPPNGPNTMIHTT